MVLGDIAAAVSHDAGHDHAAQAPEDAGHVACHEQGGDGDGACHGGVDDHDVAGGNHHAGGAGGDIADGDVLIGVALFLLQGAKDAAHGHSSGNAGAGHGAEEHIGHNVGLGQSAREPVGHQLGAAHQTAGNAAEVHQVTGQHEEGNGQQRKGVDALKHLLGGDHHGAGIGHDDVNSGGRADADAQTNGEADSQGHENKGDHYNAGESSSCHICLPPIMRCRRAHRHAHACRFCS